MRPHGCPWTSPRRGSNWRSRFSAISTCCPSRAAPPRPSPNAWATTRSRAFLRTASASPSSPTGTAPSRSGPSPWTAANRRSWQALGSAVTLPPRSGRRTASTSPSPRPASASAPTNSGLTTWTAARACRSPKPRRRAKIRPETSATMPWAPCTRPMAVICTTRRRPAASPTTRCSPNGGSRAGTCAKAPRTPSSRPRAAPCARGFRRMAACSCTVPASSRTRACACATFRPARTAGWPTRCSATTRSPDIRATCCPATPSRLTASPCISPPTAASDGCRLRRGRSRTSRSPPMWRWAWGRACSSLGGSA